MTKGDLSAGFAGCARVDGHALKQAGGTLAGKCRPGEEVEVGVTACVFRWAFMVSSRPQGEGGKSS